MDEHRIQIVEWVTVALKKIPATLRYFKDSNNIVVFLPRHIRVHLANYLAYMAALPVVNEKHDFNLVFEGWKIVDGYENALVACAIEMAGLYDEAVYRVPMTEKDAQMVLGPIVSFTSVQHATFKSEGGIVSFYEPTKPGSDIWKKHSVNSKREFEFEKEVKIDRDALNAGM